MLKRFFYATLFMVCAGFSFGQTDSTDLNFYSSAAVLETSLDSILYGDGTFRQLNLEFTIEDTVEFGKAHIELTESVSGNLVFVHVYTKAELEAAGLIDNWVVSLPFGNLSNELAYTTTLTIENYAGSLGAALDKTLNP